jgi:hypothetical protein
MGTWEHEEHVVQPLTSGSEWVLRTYRICSLLKFEISGGMGPHKLQLSIFLHMINILFDNCLNDHLCKCHIQRVGSWRLDSLVLYSDHVTCSNFRLTVPLPKISTPVHGCAVHFHSAIDNSSIMNVCSLDIESEILVSSCVTYSWIRFVRFRTGAGKGWDKVLLLKSLQTSQSLLWIYHDHAALLFKC